MTEKSAPTPGVATTPDGIDWALVASSVQKGVAALTPIVDMAAPEAAPVLDIINTILRGAVDAEPVAVALVAQLQAGTPPTPAQLQAAVLTYHADDDDLAKDIAAHIAALPAA